MAKASSYWLKRLTADRALAQRAADEVSQEMKREYRLHYAQVVKRLDSLYVEAQSRGELSRTKLWNYLSYREMEEKLADMVEGGSMIQRDKLTKTLNRVFEETIGASADRFRRDEYVLSYDPRAIIDTAWSGDHFSNRVWRNNSRLAQEVRDGCRSIVMGLESPSAIKRRLMKDFDVTNSQAERLVDTETSYVFNKANLMNYERRGRKKLTIVCLDVNTCDKCKALEGEVFLTEEAPVLPIHPRCHCAYCVPQDLDEAEVTMHGGDLEEVYARKGVKGYGDGEGAEGGAAKEYIPKNLQERIDRAANPVLDIAAPMEGGTVEVPAQASQGFRSIDAVDVKDITDVFSIGDPDTVGRVVIPDTYKVSSHTVEISVAKRLVGNYGGRLTLKTEVNQDKVKTSDFDWEEENWELKTCSTEKAADSALRKAIKQIDKNPGGIVLDYGDHEINEEMLMNVIKRRFLRNEHLNLLRVIIFRGGVSKVLELKK